jgi:hypothetical protein
VGEHVPGERPLPGAVVPATLAQSAPAWPRPGSGRVAIGIGASSDRIVWNVLTGEMSIVGPRPLLLDQVAANADLLAPRHPVPAGLTGWWQTHGRSSVTPEEALRLELFSSRELVTHP